MRRCALVRRSEGGEVDFTDFLHVVAQPHVLWAVSSIFHDVLRIHYWLSGIERGRFLMFQCVGDDGQYLGSIIGEFESEVFVGHLFFHRNVDVRSCIAEFEAVFPAWCKTRGIMVRRLAGNVPDSNRAVKILLRRMGFEDKGLIPGLECRRGKDQQETGVRRFEKEV